MQENVRSQHNDDGFDDYDRSYNDLYHELVDQSGLVGLGPDDEMPDEMYDEIHAKIVEIIGEKPAEK